MTQRPLRPGASVDPADDGGDGRAVSDLLAHVLMFAIIIGGVALVSTGAFDPLVELADREQIENSQRGMRATAATLSDIHRRADTQRSFSIVLGGGTVLFNHSNISVSSPNATRLNATYAVNSLEHRFELPERTASVSYEAGAVFVTPGVFARYDPGLECGNDTAIVSLVRLNASDIYISEGMGGPTVLDPRGIPEDAPVTELGRTLLFSAELQSQQRNVTRFGGDRGTIRVNVSASANPIPWSSYFGLESEWTAAGQSTYQCTGVETALVRVTTVDLDVG